MARIMEPSRRHSVWAVRDRTTWTARLLPRRGIIVTSESPDRTNTRPRSRRSTLTALPAVAAVALVAVGAATWASGWPGSGTAAASAQQSLASTTPDGGSTPAGTTADPASTPSSVPASPDVTGGSATSTAPRPAPVAPTAAAPAGDVVVHGPDGLPTAPVHLRAGQRLVVQLQEQAGSTGYSWAVAQTGTGLDPAGDKLVPAATPMPGAVSPHVFSFTGGKPGSTTLTFPLRRPWESAPIKTVTLTVVVG
jgi:predicted secreted protein